MPFIEKNAGIDGSIEGHKSFSAKYIEDLVDKDSNASLVYKVGS
jgi:hypothetical protein